ncbi:hypothetical protein [Nonomuraea sp. B1E8]|uniref:hypothetical protein n=1 Tax=unclassified Nonomuraea TaxID=2593643 RepID=UPI00325CC082
MSPRNGAEPQAAAGDGAPLRTATEVDTHRRLTRVTLTAMRARALREARACERKQRRAFAQLDIVRGLSGSGQVPRGC